jgi:phage shock protein C
MFCNQCGNTLEEHFRYCSKCGTATESASRTTLGWRDRLTRPREGIKIAGVCAGVARYLDLDVTLVRIVWLLLAILPPVPGFLAYLVCWIIMEKDPLPVRQESPSPAPSSESGSL